MLSLLLMLTAAFLAIVLLVATGVTFYEVVLVPREPQRDMRGATRSADWTKPKR